MQSYTIYINEISTEQIKCFLVICGLSEFTNEWAERKINDDIENGELYKLNIYLLKMVKILTCTKKINHPITKENDMLQINSKIIQYINKNEQSEIIEKQIHLRPYMKRQIPLTNPKAAIY